MVAIVPSASDLATLVDALRGVLVQYPEVHLALLFGSQVTGATHAESDVDIAYLGQCTDRLQLATQLSERCGRNVDLVSLHDPGVPLLEEVIRDGILIHETAPNVYSTWRSHALSSLEIDRPWYNRMRDAWLKSVAQRGL